MADKPHPQTWDDYRDACLRTYGGGYQPADEREIFHHGIETVFNFLSAEFPEAQTCLVANQLLTMCRIALRVIGPVEVTRETLTPEVVDRLDAILGLYRVIQRAEGEPQ